jgi:hypothetical protein
MRDVWSFSLVSWAVIGTAACVPTLPGVGQVPPTSEDASPIATPGSSDPPPWDPTFGSPVSGPSRAAPTSGTAHEDAASVGPSGDPRADGGAPDRAQTSDATSDMGSARASDATEARETPGARPPRAGELVIDELLVDPAGNDLGHEWIELANLANEPLALGTLYVSDGATEVAVDAGVLAAGGLLVLGQSVDRAHNGDAPVALAYGTKLALNNGADRVALCLGSCAGGPTLDAVAWMAAWGEAYAGHAVVIERDGTTCPATEPYGSAGNFGSPGRTNPPCPRALPDPDVDGGDAR